MNDRVLLPVYEPHPDTSPDYEYTQYVCDIWELHHLCNHMAGFRWEPVFAVESHDGAQLPERIGDDNGPVRKGRPLRPYVILFRRLMVIEEDGDDE